jgi:glutathione S-transferase
VSEKAEVKIIGPGMDKSAIAAALTEAYLGHSIIFFLDPWERKNKKEYTLDEMIGKMASSMMPIVATAKEDLIYYTPEPSKLERRKKANQQRSLHNKHFKTKIKSLKR